MLKNCFYISACHLDCHGVGQEACTGSSQSDCCPYYHNETQACITSCVSFDEEFVCCKYSIQNI